MSADVRIVVGGAELPAKLNDSLTASTIAGALPLEGTANRWGEEIYFSIPVRIGESADARQDMEVGELAYWPVGAAVCIFFGPTPVSTGAAPRAYSNVNPFGRIDAAEATIKNFFSSVKDGQPIRIVAADDQVQ